MRGKGEEGIPLSLGPENEPPEIGRSSRLPEGTEPMLIVVPKVRLAL